jgi:hypothetical protein
MANKDSIPGIFSNVSSGVNKNTKAEVELAVMAQLQNLIDNGGLNINLSGGTLSYNTLAELQAAYPNGIAKPVWIVEDKSWYYWNGAIIEPTPDTTPPANVTGLNATSVTQTSMTIGWTSVNDAVNYQVFKDGVLVSTVSTAFYLASGLTAGTSYSWVIKSKDAAGNTSSGSNAFVQATLAENVTPPTDTTPPTVTASVQGGTYTSAQSVILSTEAGATIYYTTDGTNPTYPVSGSTQTYSSAIAINSTTTLKYIGRDAAGNVSTVQSQAYTINIADTTVPVLTITPAATFSTTQTVTMSATDDSNLTTIYYTDDNTDPLTSGTKKLYSAPLSLSVTTTIKAYAVDPSNNKSAVQTVVYTYQSATSSTLTSVTDSLIHSYDFRTGTGTQATLNDLTGTAHLTLAGYLYDGTSGWTANGLVSNNVGHWNITTPSTIGIAQGTNFSISLAFIYTDLYPGKILFKTNDSFASGVNIGTAPGTYGRFSMDLANTFNSKQPRLQVVESTGVVSTVQSTGESIVKDAKTTLTITYDATTNIVKWYVNGVLNNSYTSITDLKFDGFFSGTSLITHRKMLFHSKVLTSTEVQTIATELNA